MNFIFKLTIFALLLAVLGCAAVKNPKDTGQSSLVLFDALRQRQIPVEIYFPPTTRQCDSQQLCPVAIISAGYGIGHKDYSFIASALNEIGYLVLAVQHQLPSDPPLATSGDLFSERIPNWQSGAENLRFVQRSMRDSQPEFDWDHPVLVGHSNGGDISAWTVREQAGFADTLITLDHRRVPLPRALKPRVLSLRASDSPADDGVLPSDEELSRYGDCVMSISNSRHNDMHDGGSIELKTTISRAIVAFMGKAGAVMPNQSFKGTCLPHAR